MKFYPYLLAQYPDAARFSEILDLTLRYADAIEIGIPFTDPVADGPILASAASKVLANGFSLDALFALLQRKKIVKPLAMMSYANPVLAYGKRDFLQASAECGAKYLIVPDVPFEESEAWRGIAAEQGLSWISFISLTTSAERLQKIAAASEGFIYLLSLKGITGGAIHNPEEIQNKALQIKQYTNTSIALGFGIKSAQDTLPYRRDLIDIFIVGSRIIEFIETNQFEELEHFYESFRRLL